MDWPLSATILGTIVTLAATVYKIITSGQKDPGRDEFRENLSNRIGRIEQEIAGMKARLDAHEKHEDQHFEEINRQIDGLVNKIDMMFIRGQK